MDILPEIDLSENRITNNTIDKLIETLKTTKFKKLNLESVFTKNNKQETFEILRKICEVIKESTNLEELIISKNALGKSGAKALKVFLTNNVNLKHLIIDDAGLGEGESLSLCKKLQIINLEDNFFTKKTSKMLSRSLANWLDLKQLIINDCLICKKVLMRMGSILWQLNLVSKKNGTLINGFDDLINEDDEGEEKEEKEKEGKEKELDDNEVEEIHNDMKGKGGKGGGGLDVEEEEGDYDGKEE
ncbi:Ran GTPase-activating protein 1 [Rhizophagus irregularis DAOM 181602=DAOM 197198]|nr:Ran GTPase-activating protein 1 [Rhizophagus irregularis DAOM 181602=DAOM 197198]